MSLLSVFTSYFFEKSLILSPSVLLPIHLSAYDSVYLQSFLSLLSSSSSSSYSSASSSAPSQIHLCLLSFLHVVAAIFSPYLEPDILSLLMILKWTPGILLPEHAWSPITASPFSNPISPQLQPTNPFYITLYSNFTIGCWTHGTDTMACFYHYSQCTVRTS